MYRVLGIYNFACCLSIASTAVESVDLLHVHIAEAFSLTELALASFYALNGWRTVLKEENEIRSSKIGLNMAKTRQKSRVIEIKLKNLGSWLIIIMLVIFWHILKIKVHPFKRKRKCLKLLWKIQEIKIYHTNWSIEYISGGF